MHRKRPAVKPEPKRPWSKGAPRSKKSAGVGKQKGVGGRFCSDKRDPTLPTSVPLPKNAEDVTDATMADFLVPPPATPPAP